jgi:hypothetical protein
VIESSVVDWVGTSSSAGTRVHLGARLQEGILPAVVVRVTAGERVCLEAGTGNNVDRYDVAIDCVAETMLLSRSLAAQVRSAFITNALLDLAVCFEPTWSIIDEPVVGEGDEAEPAVCRINFTVYYRS